MAYVIATAHMLAFCVIVSAIAFVCCWLLGAFINFDFTIENTDWMALRAVAACVFVASMVLGYNL